MSAPDTKLSRRDVVAALLRDRSDLLVVTGLGSPAYDVHAAGNHAGTFYLWGAMGGAALVGLGLAQAQPGRDVMVVTGDGEQLMGLGGLATIGAAKPRNLTVVVIDNQHFGETGMQASHTGRGVDIAAVAAGCGFASAVAVADASGLTRLCEDLARTSDGPRLAVVKVAPLNPPRSLPIRDAVALKTRFRAALGLSPS